MKRILLSAALAALVLAGQPVLVAWAKTQEHHVCGPYTFEAEVAEDGTANLSSRERLRRAGGESARARLGY